MTSVWANWRIWLLIAALVLSIGFIAWKGIQYGIDFKGGTSFQIKLAKPVSSPEEMSRILTIISKRMDWTGLKDTTVISIGNDLILADIAETDPGIVDQLESLLIKQGKFEATLDGNVLFTGADLISVSKNPRDGYGLSPQTDGSVQWMLPFSLKGEAAKHFTEKTFHQCQIIGVDPAAGRQYDCPPTYFFIDRPEDAVILVSAATFLENRESLLSGNIAEDIPGQTNLADLLSNAQIPVVQMKNESLAGDGNAAEELRGLAANHSMVIVPESLDEISVKQLSDLGFKNKKIPVSPGVPYLWVATGAKQVISLSEEVTNQSPYVDNIADAKIYSELLIRGFGSNQEEGQKRLNNITVLLESGSLPIPVESISKETISPQLGKEFFDQTLWMGIIAIIVIAIIIFIRYRHFELVIPILATVVFEAFIVLGIAAIIGWKLDLASVAGIIAAIGTGVNDQIVITDELLKRKKEEEYQAESEGFKRAFFIVMAAASTALATMLPIIIFGFGLGKLVGFAITTTFGVLVGVLLTRPAYGIVARELLSKQKK